MSQQCAWNEKAQFGVKISTCKGIGIIITSINVKHTKNETCSIKTREQISHLKHVTVVADGTGRGDGVGVQIKGSTS